MTRKRSSKPTEAQMAVLDEYRKFIRTNGYPPTLIEVATAMGFSSDNAIRCHLVELERRGLVTRVAGKPRAIRINSETEPRETEERGTEVI